MAINSRAKRDSALLEQCGIPVPDGTLDAPDRLWMLGQYYGIEAAVPAIPVREFPEYRPWRISRAGDRRERVERSPVAPRRVERRA